MRSQFPKSPAIYFVIQGECILYIGQTVNLAQRWVAHHRWSEFKTLNPLTRVAWLECTEIELLSEIEAVLISHFAPPMNGIVVGTVKLIAQL